MLNYRMTCMALIGLAAYACSDDDDPETTPDLGIFDAGPSGDGGLADGGADAGTTDGGGGVSGCPQSAYCIDGTLTQPVLGTRSASTLTVDGYTFKDHDGDGQLDPYEDWRLSSYDRAKDLVSKMSTAERVGLLGVGGFNINPETDEGYLSEEQRTGVIDGHIRQSLLRWPGTASAELIATVFNNFQALAEEQPLGVPMIFTTDPIFGSASDMQSTQLTHFNSANQILDWPLVLGLGAINDAAYVENIGRMQAAQLRAVGMRWMLGPQIDLATEPMWSRVYDTFGADSARVGAMGTAWVRGFQGGRDGLNPLTGVAATVKHFPGGGANENGMDSHDAEFGRYNVYPGNNLEEHVNTMKAVIEGSNPGSIMPNYSVFEDVSWNGVMLENIAASYQRAFMQDILRTDFGWDGMVTSDWGAIGYCPGPMVCIPSRAYGLETLSNGEIISRYLDVGGHQIGSVFDTVHAWEDALASGHVTDEDLIPAAEKVIEMTFAVGAFENPYVDPSMAVATIESFAPQARDAMRRAFTLLKNDTSILPLDANTPDVNGTAGVRVWYDGHDDAAIENYVGQVAGLTRTATLADADYAILRVSARWGSYFGFDGGVPLSWTDPVLVFDQMTNRTSTVASTHVSRDDSAQGNNALALLVAQRLDQVMAAKAASPGMKVIVVVSMMRPFIIAPWLNDIDVLAAEFGMSDATLLDMLFQMKDGAPDPTLQPTGTLPMEIPSSQQAVYEAYEDVPQDSANPSFPLGAGMTTY